MGAFTPPHPYRSEDFFRREVEFAI